MQPYFIIIHDWFSFGSSERANIPESDDQNNDEENHENDDQDEAKYFLLQGCKTLLGTTGKFGNLSENRILAGIYKN